MILACSGWACPRFIAASEGSGPGQPAGDDQEQVSTRFRVCADCRANFCDRCAPSALLRQARCLLCEGRLVDGRQAGRVWWTPLPGFVLYHRKGVQLSEAGRFRAALDAFDEAARRRPRYRSAHFHRGLLLARLGRYEQARAAFVRVTELDARHVAARFELGRTLRHLGRPEEALRAYDQALVAVPRYAMAWAHKAQALTDLGCHDEALAACDNALHLHETGGAVEDSIEVPATAYAAQAAVMLALGFPGEALAAVDASLQDEPDRADTYALRARILDDLGRDEEAIEDRRQAARLREE
jgi:tetratricopeptide (TPR) repeat protein